jgi:redox-sensitive bicupin YhaK (pirin superfamily)
MKQIIDVYSAPTPHWVGDGFPVRSLFSYHSHAEQLSPFLLLDYAGPMRFEPATQPRGVAQHPHRGFETVTIVYDGEVAHRDSTGSGGTIGPGDVQWMTAAAGILHEEFHSPGFTRSGGMLEMVQLWVNLPAKDKMSTPRYQSLLAHAIPSIELPQGAGRLRVIAGEYGGQRGPAHTFTPLDVWDVRLKQNHNIGFSLPADRTLVLVVLRGDVLVNDARRAGEAQFMTFDRAAGDVTIEARSEAMLLVLAGEPIEEPIVAHGPFVMNSEQQIRQAISDFNSGRFGQLTAQR